MTPVREACWNGFFIDSRLSEVKKPASAGFFSLLPKPELKTPHMKMTTAYVYSQAIWSGISGGTDF